jgi:hypothetical protein
MFRFIYIYNHKTPRKSMVMLVLSSMEEATCEIAKQSSYTHNVCYVQLLSGILKLKYYVVIQSHPGY